MRAYLLLLLFIIPVNLMAADNLNDCENSIVDEKNLDISTKLEATFADANKLGAHFFDIITKLADNPDAALDESDIKQTLAIIAQSLRDAGKLEASIRKALEVAEQFGKIPNSINDKQKNLLVKTLLTAINAELQQRGYDEHERNYETWNQLSARLNTEIEGLGITGDGVDTLNFWKAHADQTNAPLYQATNVEVLVDGPASFKKRAEILDSAQKEILILSWSIQDDETGDWLKNKLIKKAKQGLSVKVMVDGQTSMRKGYQDVLADLEKAGIELVRWRSPEASRQYDGQHRKFMIVDGEHLVGGGLNIGNHYSHMGPSDTTHWRDTDLYFQGDAVQEVRNQFADLWNEQLLSLNLKGLSTVIPSEVSPTKTPTGISAVNHYPGRGENILRSIVLAIEAAKDRIVIENAYFILGPVIERALLRAIERGVKVVILANSPESIDEPTITRPILKSLNMLFNSGARIYTKPGRLQTLHSKAMSVDSGYAWVGSQNFHPRSYRLEGEIIFVTNSQNNVSRINQMFEQDFSDFNLMTIAFPIEENALLDFQESLFFDQL